MFEISQLQINEIIANMSGTISDLLPLLLVILGIILGLWIFAGIIGRNITDVMDDPDDDDFYN